MIRTTFLVDGFNLYHSAKRASCDLHGISTKWLDLGALLCSFLPLIDRAARLQEIYYFTALATHLDTRKPGNSARHQLYIECLESTGIHVELGRFKSKSVWCNTCKTATPHYEEKETDVAISTKLLELFHYNACDTAVLVTGDTDLAPAVRAVQRIHPTKEVCFAFPYMRKNKELAALVCKHFKISKERYAAHQFPDPCTLPDGRQLSKPLHW